MLSSAAAKKVITETKSEGKEIELDPDRRVRWEGKWPLNGFP